MQPLYGLCQGDVARLDKVTGINIHKALLFLAFEKDKIELEKLQLEKYRK
jgi:hypothetical protein